MKLFSSSCLVFAVLLTACAAPSGSPPSDIAGQGEAIGKSCSKDAQCSGTSTPICLASGVCGQCSATNTKACTGANKYCNLTTNMCVGCTSNTQCAGTMPVCGSNNQCSACNSDSQCGAAAPACLPSGACGQCSASNASVCKGSTPICEPVSSKCVACPAGGCPKAAPVCTLTAGSANLVTGKSTTLTFSAAGATTWSIDQGIGTPKSNPIPITPKLKTTYTLSARNYLGACSASVTVNVGTPPSVSGFTANPSTLIAGQSTASKLSWTASGATSVSIDKGVGSVTGNNTNVSPAVTTTYTVTATNAFGAASATTTLTVGKLPSINAFWTNGVPAGPGVSATLNWDVLNATTLMIDQGVGKVTGTKVSVSPKSATTYTLTASNAIGSVSAKLNVAYMPLATLSSQLYHSEHVLFIIPNASQVNFTGANSWDSVYAPANIDSYVAQLKQRFPSDYFMVVVMANNLLPAKVPNVITARKLADGIGQNSVTGVGVPNICRYHVGTGSVVDGALGVFDHEIGHNWGVNIGSEVGVGHWLANSTVSSQMSATYSDDNYSTVKLIAGDPLSGFTWSSLSNATYNETVTFSDQDLYLQGFGAVFPDVYVLNAPVYNADHSVSYAGVTKYDQAWLSTRHGSRNPTYRTSPKRLRIGFLYIARNLAEVQAVYQPMERSVEHYVNAEQIDKTKFRFQVPFLVETKHRASLDALLADLDGNTTPTLSISGPTYLATGDGTASVPFVAKDGTGTAPVVSCVPSSANCSIAGGKVVMQGLPPGSHFITIKAEDSAGKRVFNHFVVDAN